MMEGESLSAAPAERIAYQSNPELEEECIKLQNVVDKMVWFEEQKCQVLS